MKTAAPDSSARVRALHDRPVFRYLYLVGLLVFTLICAYVFLFSGSVALEGLVKGWFRTGASETDNYAFWWSCLTSFPCLLGVIGGIGVLTTGTTRFHNIKVLLFTPAVVWTTQLVLVNFKWGLTYWMQWLYLVPLMLLSLFMLYGIIKQARVPILMDCGQRILQRASD